MLTPYVLTTVTAPRQRLGISESALIVPVMATAAVYLLTGWILSVPVVWAISHAVMLVVCYVEPHYMTLRRGQRYPKTARRLSAELGKKGQGAIYGA